MKKIAIILSLIGFNYCFGVYKAKDVRDAITDNDISYFEEVVKDKSFKPNISLAKESGFPPLLYIIEKNRETIFDLLLDVDKKNACKKVDVNQKTFDGNCFPLILACTYKQNRDCYVRKLLAHPDININNIMNDGTSAFLYVVCAKKHHNLVSLFLDHLDSSGKHDIDLNMKYKEKTVYQYAMDRGYTDIAKAISEAQNKIENEKKQSKKNDIKNNETIETILKTEGTQDDKKKAV